MAIHYASQFGQDFDVAMTRAIEVANRGPIYGENPRVGCLILDPVTGERQDILPEAYRSNSTVYNLHHTGRYVMATVLYAGIVLVFDAETAAVVAEIPQAEVEGTWMSTAGGTADRPTAKAGQPNLPTVGRGRGPRAWTAGR